MPKKQYNIRIEQSLLEKIQRKAMEDRRSVNQSIEIAIENYCKVCDGYVTKPTNK